MNKISVIIPIFNAEKTLDRCLESVTQQTYKNLEIILIDDGSKDASKEKCYGWAKKDKRIKVIVQENSGVSAARNAGINIATGDYIAFVDSDDWLDLTMYEKLLCKATEEKADLTFCRLSRISYNKVKKEIITDKGLEQVVFNGELRFFFVTDENYVIGSLNRILILKSIIGEMRLDEKIYFAEDCEFLIRLLGKSKYNALVEEELYFYEYSDSISCNNKYYSKEWWYHSLERLGDKLKTDLVDQNFNELSNAVMYLIYQWAIEPFLLSKKYANPKKKDGYKNIIKFNKKVNYKAYKKLFGKFNFKQNIKLLLLHSNHFMLLRTYYYLAGKII